MSATSRHAGGPSGAYTETIVVGSLIAVVVAAAAIVNLIVRLGADDAQQLPANPFTLLFEVLDGTLAWPAAGTAIAAALAAVLMLLAIAAGVLLRRGRAGRSRVDRAASRMGRGRDIAALTHRGARETARRLGVDAPGLPLGRTVSGNSPLYASWEDVVVDIAGPRTGKTTGGSAIMVLEAPGACVSTTNKRDLVDATRDPRASVGHVWVFDPQAIVDEPVNWWWNPLTYVTDEVKAKMLADIFTSASRTDLTARTDAFFEPAATELLANLLLAAAVAKRPITQVYLWLTDPSEDEAVEILHADGRDLVAAGLREVINAPEKQRGGVYGTAKQIASFLTNRQAVQWVIPSAGSRREFDPHAFVRSTDTLYSISREGIGSAAPLVTALTVAVMEAAEALAQRSPGGRLITPIAVVLDEAANVCVWRQLPNQYSHYGSKGVNVITYLQSWSQGVEVWGEHGMRKLWSAANVKIYGGGVAERGFLEDLSAQIGQYQLQTTSLSHGRGGTSHTSSVRAEAILDVADLAGLPKGRAVVLASGQRATLVRRVAWMASRHADAVRASIRAHDPCADDTIASMTKAVEPPSANGGAAAA